MGKSQEMGEPPPKTARTELTKDTLNLPIDSLKPAESLFLHYCSLDAFYSIMNTGRLRFTSARNTNDPSELSFGNNCVDQVLHDLPESVRPAEKEWLRPEMDKLQEFRAFVFCMSEALDDEADVGELSQWRLYGSDGRGVALLFDTSEREREKLLIQLGSHPRNVVYGSTDGQALIARILTERLELLRSLGSEAKNFIRDSADKAQFVLDPLRWLPSVIKHKAYRHEREVRLLKAYATPGELLFFEKGGIRRPAIELPISSLLADRHVSPIKAVIIGPSGDQASIADSIRYFLDARGWALDVRRSDIPYRAV